MRDVLFRKDQLQEWLNELLTPYGEFFRFYDEGESDGEAHYRGSVIFCTAAHCYHLTFSDTYLGCTVSSRIVRPGENWIRGDDLSNGKFSREVFDRIMWGILAYELVALAPQVKPEEVPARECQR